MSAVRILLSVADVQQLVDEREAAVTRADRLADALRDFTTYGLRCDLNPTMYLGDVSSLYSAFVDYLKQADKSVRSRALAALKEEKP